ncbi:A/G-specific adenine glycosylase [Rhodobacterales bacterium LSUCC0031]|nr:A/G-specific adenine glycosylase [Rhodobacterales bacterium LSUCC0031]
MRDGYCDNDASAALLPWYDAHARDLPWRIGPDALAQGLRPDPYKVWLSEIMLQQTTVAAVRDYFRDFTMRWPHVAALAAADDAEVMGAWAGLGYYARARNLLKCARVVAHDHGGRFPQSEAELLALPGIGPYTAAAIAAIAFDRPAAVMDGNVERVLARLFAVQTPLPAAKTELKALVERLTPGTRPGCYAQAVMDLGATICTPRAPACGICPLRAMCRASAMGIAAELPRKSPKKQVPTRHGIAYLARRADGAMLLETRPETGLLGGMLGWPGSDWAAAPPAEVPPIAANWHDPGLEVRHTFTHFHLRLSLRLGQVAQDATPARGAFHLRDSFRPANLPTVMRKAWDLARDAWPKD